MRCLSGSFLVIALAGVYSVAQSVPTCKAAAVSTIDHRHGITARVVWFQGSFRKLTAHAFVPDAPEPAPGIVFSHSSIQYPDAFTDLLPFARALARSGAASIMIDGTIDWRTPNDDSKRPWQEVSCAARWLMANANMDGQRLAFGGPMTEGGDPFCPELGAQACSGQAWFYFNFGSTSVPHGVSLTELMKTPQGQLRLTELPGGFGLKPVPLEWLMDDGFPHPWRR
jgi:hypothetical protein